MDIDKLLQLLHEEALSAERGTWYGGGSDATSDALYALVDVIKRVQYRLEEEK